MVSVRKIFLLIHSNLRRAGGQTLSIGALILLAAAMLNLWLMLVMDYKQNFDRHHDRLHAEHVTMTLDGNPENVRSFLTRTLEADSGVSEFHMTDALCMVGGFPYNGGKVNTWLVIREKETAKNCPVGRVEILEEDENISGIYLPLLYKTEDIAVGRSVELQIGDHTVKYTVCGFFNSVMAGSHNCVMTQVLLTQDLYRELEGKGYAPGSTLLSVRLHDRTESEKYEASLKSRILAEFPGVMLMSNNYLLVTTSRYISQMICAGVVSAMAFFVLLIALVVIASNIGNYIQESMKNLGTLKAVGYTGGQIIRCLLTQFLGIDLLAAIPGAGLSYLLFPSVNAMMISQTGIPYEVRFLPLPCLLTLALLGTAVALAVWASSRRIRKIDPIAALRQGIQTHNFRKNHVPLEKTGLPLHLALAVKNTYTGLRQNVAVCVTMLALSLVVVFSGLMMKNMFPDAAPFLDMVVGELADSCINVNAGVEEAFLREMRANGDVEKIYLYHSSNVNHVGGVELLMTCSDDFSRINNQKICIQGRFPRYDNEVAVAVKYAREKNLKIGSEITLALGDEKADYIITGYTQISNNLGKDCLLTREGYEKLGELSNVSYYLNLREGADIGEFNEAVSRRFAGNVNTAQNIRSIVEGTSSVYITLVKILVGAVLLLSVAIITFVLYLLVRAMLNRKKQDYGILKALGFTTNQLILQTALSFMPAMFLSTAVSLTVCCLAINPLMAVFLSGIGIVKSTFTVPVGMIAAAGTALVFLAFGIACLLSLKIRKIVPRELLTGE